MKKITGKKLDLLSALLVLLILSILTTFVQIFMQVSDPDVFAGYFRIPMLFFLNTLPVFLCAVFLYFATGSICAGYSITAAFVFVLLTVNHYKIHFRDEPLIPNDLHLFKEASNILQNYDIYVSMRVVLCGVIIIILAVLTGLLFHDKREKWYVRCTGIVCVTVLGFISLKFSCLHFGQ